MLQKKLIFLYKMVEKEDFFGLKNQLSVLYYLNISAIRQRDYLRGPCLCLTPPDKKNRTFSRRKESG